MATSSSNTTSTTILNRSNLTSQTPLLIRTNLSNILTVKLDLNNYILWRYQITSILITYSMLEYVDGTFECPP
jgi:hypothetical protein